MNNRLIKYFFTTSLMFSAFSSLSAQTPDAMKILDGVQRKFKLVKEYEAAVRIKVDVDFIKIPVKEGIIWFMQPDQVRVKTPGFSLLPKRGMNFSPNQLFSGEFTAIYSRTEQLDGTPVHVIKVIPQNEKDDIILSTLWVDDSRNIIRKLETTTKNEGTFSMKFIFSPQITTYDLPREIIFNFDIRKNELPIGLTGDFESKEISENSDKSGRGTVTISYLNYIVNEGKAIPIFIKKGKLK